MQGFPPSLISTHWVTNITGTVLSPCCLILSTSHRGKYSYDAHDAGEGGTARCQFPDSLSLQAADHYSHPAGLTQGPRSGRHAELLSYTWRRRFAAARGVTPAEGSMTRPARLEVGTRTRGAGVQKAVASLYGKSQIACCASFLLAAPGFAARGRLLRSQGRGHLHGAF